jgi:hypothetical protein
MPSRYRPPVFKAKNFLSPGELLRSGTVDGGQDALQSGSQEYYFCVSFHGQMGIYRRSDLNVLWSPVDYVEARASLGSSTANASLESQIFSWYNAKVTTYYGVIFRNVIRMQTDGNLCLYQEADKFLVNDNVGPQVAMTEQKNTTLRWQTATSGQPRFAILHNDGNLCVYNGSSPADQGDYQRGAMGGPFTYDPYYYLETYPDLKVAFSSKAYGTNFKALMAHWVTIGLPKEGRRASRVFDVSYYLNRHQDLKAAFGTNYQAAYDHWVGIGLPKEGRRGSADFDVSYYLATYADLANAFGANRISAVDHWLNYGIKERRKSAP